MDLGLAGSKAVVTGGSKGMGLAIAETLAAEGASVAVMARGRAALDAAVESCGQPALRTPSASAWTWPMPHPSPPASPASPSAGAAQQPGTHHRARRRILRGDGRRRMGRRVRARHHVGRALDSCRAAHAARRRLGTHRDSCPRTPSSDRTRASSPTRRRRRRCPASPRTCRKALPRTAFWSTACAPAPSSRRASPRTSRTSSPPTASTPPIRTT